MACPAGWFRRGFHFHPPIMHNDDIQDQRSGFANDNIQELLDAAVSAGHALQVGAQQYQTPSWLARGLASQLPSRSEPTLDPQCAAGNLLMAMATNSRFGWDLDARHAESNRDFINRIRGNCVKLGATLAPLTDGARSELGIGPDAQGVVVTSLGRDSRACQAGAARSPGRRRPVGAAPSAGRSRSVARPGCGPAG